MVNCLHCANEIEGRTDKKFCSPYCRSAFHYQKNKEKEDTLFKTIDKQLKTNRKILKTYNKAGLATVAAQKIIQEGFNPNYFTHYWKNKKGQIYLFCYEYGYLELKDAHKKKYVLVTWQDYMDS
ncbi:hypothetical protein [Aquimarina mytili]|uniref:DUF2116 family Zn-ribbon domain-containing protein n=1 Tax=Aquimarina mytili TaxID=874423 RepID=A0A937DBM1_9FLAO|nr:hypothetical protein [Aquimarina mytili]MBL0685887.1 hypothetical protein [Aquimarina mytili]